MAKAPAVAAAAALMRAGVRSANHPQTATTAVSPLVQSIGQWGTTGRGGAEVMPRPFNVFDAGAFGPGTPLWPMTIDVPNPESGEVEPRRTQYPVFWNLPVGVPGSEGLGTYASFAMLRGYADQYNIARRCIEARKKEMLGLEWDIVPTPEASEAMKGSATAKADWNKRQFEAMEILSRPDRSPDSPTRNWSEFMDMILEDRYVIDAVSIYMHPPLGGRGTGWLGSNIGSFDYIDGSTLRPLYDLRGGTPPPSTPAYQQFLWGVPRTDYATMAEGRDLDELPEYVGDFKYREMRYIRSVMRGWTPYGFSPIEQGLLPIQIGLARQNSQLQFYTDGSMPYMYVIPGEQLIQSPQQVRQLQNALNAIAGDQVWKQKIVVLPPGSDTRPLKPNELSDQFDEFLVSMVTAMFGMSPQDLGIAPKVSGVLNSASSRALTSANSQNSLDHWLEPETKAWALEFNFIIQKVFRQNDMVFKWTGLDEPEDESQIATDALAKFKGAGITLDELRMELGMDPFEEDWSQVPLLIAGDQAIPLSTAVESSIWEFEQAKLQPKPIPMVEAPWTPAPPGAPAPSGGSSGGDQLTTVSHEAAQQSEESKPTPPTSAKAQLAELDTMLRVLRKGRAFGSFEPRVISPRVYEAVQHALAPLGLEAAIDKGREAVLDEHEDYLAELAYGVAKGTVRKETLAYESGRIAAEGVVLKAKDADAQQVYAYLLQQYPAKDLAWVRSCDWVKKKSVPLTDMDMARRPGGRNEAKVNALTAAMKAGLDDIPPVVLVDGGEPKLTLADGYHRSLAAEHAGIGELPAYVGTPGPGAGDWQAQIFAMQAAKLGPTATDNDDNGTAKSAGNAVLVTIPDDMRISDGDTIEVVWKNDTGFDLVSKPSVHYRRATVEAENCGDCVYFNANGSCDRVEGRVEPEYVCDLWHGQPGRVEIEPVELKSAPPLPPETRDEPHVTTRTPEEIAEDEKRVKGAEEGQERADPDAPA